MSTAIWKANLYVTDVQQLLLPPCKFLSVAMQYGDPCIWFLVSDTNAERVECNIYMVKTGEPCDSMFDKQFVGTLLMYGGKLVLHVFVDA